jgi:PPM family protein phosphatase
MNISIGARTDVGGRSNNEDCLAVLDRDRVPIRADAVLIIADGMGGRSNGEEASGIAVKIARETVMELLDPEGDQPLPPAEDILAAGMRRANSTVYDLSQENPDTPGMGTTCIAALVSEGILTLAHVGDSRAYLVRENIIRPLTADHTYVADQVRAGNMTAEAAKKSRFRNVITRAIGIAPTVQPDFETFPLLDRDTVLLCTDGLSNTLDEEEMLEVIKKSDSAQGTANALLEAAKAGGVRDNVTIIALRVSSDVLSNKLKRSQLARGSNGTKPDGTLIDADEPTKPEKKILELPKPEPVAVVPPPQQSSGFRLIAVAVLSAMLAAAVTAGALFEIGWLKSPQSTTAPAVAKSGPPPSAADGWTFSSPTQLYYKPVRPNFLLLVPDGLLVAAAQTGAIVHLSFTGQELANVSGEPTSKFDSEAMSYTSDSAGNIYVTDSAAGTVTLDVPSYGKQTVLATHLNRPSAIVVDSTGNIYVIDNGQLDVMHPNTSPGK